MKAKKTLLPLWAIPVLIGLAIGTVWLRLWIVRTTYAIDQANQTIQTLQQQRDRMQFHVSGLRSPRKLEVLARTHFGLTQPRSDQVVHLR